MQLDTKRFGTLEIDETGIIDFEEGLPGFENMKKYVLLNASDGESPFRWLQSVDFPQISFATVDPFAIKKDYEFEIDDDVLSALDLADAKDVLVLSIVVVPADFSKMTMNLKAPVVVNTRNKRGIQIILDIGKYGVRHYILEELQGREAAGNVSPDKEERPVDNNR